MLNFSITYLVFTNTISHFGQSVQKNPSILSVSDLHLWLKVSPVSLFQNWISWFDLWIANNFESKEYRIDNTGPSLIESEVGATWEAKGTVFHEKTYQQKDCIPFSSEGIKTLKLLALEIQDNSISHPSHYLIRSWGKN